VAIENKEELYLFNATTFEPISDPSGYRTKDNFKRSWALVLDFDNGTLSPEEFEHIFWYDVGPLQKRSFIICNSFSRSIDMPNKFRVIMPFKLSAMSIDEFQAVHDAIIDKVVECGYEREALGLDKQCRSGVQSYYVPCINRVHPEYAFFRAYGMRPSEFEQYAIQPQGYLLSRALPVERGRLWVNREKELTHEEIAEINRMGAEIKGMAEGRHDLLWKLATKMRSAGMNRDEICRRVFEVAGQDKKMRKKAKDVMVSLKEYSFLTVCSLV
jgi:hypothetical protein